MKNLGIFAVVSVALCAAVTAGSGCSSNGGTGASGGSSSSTTSSTTTSSTTTSTTTSSGTGGSSSGTTTTTSNNPAPPTIGTQIDRMGRPAINTALNHAFDPTASTAGAAKDTYNQDANPAMWAANYTPEIAKNLAILDSLDTVCGNQPAYGAPPSTMSYTTLGGVLAGDTLWLNTAGTTCKIYLAVEANAALGVTNMDCGGRTLSEDVIDVSYSVLAEGKVGTTPVGDGVPANDVAFLTTFPYLAAAH